MEKECSAVQSSIDAWVQGKKVAPPAFLHIRKHIDECKDCAIRYGALLPFIEKETGMQGEYLFPEDTVGPDFTNSVLKRITLLPVGKRKKSQFFVPAAAVAVFLLALGSVLFITKGSFGGEPDEILVRFTLTAPEAKQVHLVGDFTDWNPLKLRREGSDGSGTWHVNIKLRKGGIYLYNFIIDDALWIPDPSSDTSVEDGFGGESSLLKL